MTVSIVFIITHGDKFQGSNPTMTGDGFWQVSALRDLLPAEPSAVICGTGWRHHNVAEALCLIPTRWTSLVGDADSQEETEDGRKIIVLASGIKVNPEDYTSLEDTAYCAKALITHLPDNSVVCGGRPLMIMLGHPNAKSAAIYKVTSEDGKIINISEVSATGQ